MIFQNFLKFHSPITTCEITYNNFEISLVVFMPNITTNHAITYTNLGYLNQALNNPAQSFTRKAPKQYYNCPGRATWFFYLLLQHNGLLNCHRKFRPIGKYSILMLLIGFIHFIPNVAHQSKLFQMLIIFLL